MSAQEARPGLSPASELPAGVWECQHCCAPVVIRPLRDRRRWPFERTMVSADDLPEELRWVPVRFGHGVVMVPAMDMNPRRLESIRWFAQRHTCAQWLLAHRGRYDQVDNIADVLTKHLGMAPQQ